jgi:hypothetical protein
MVDGGVVLFDNVQWMAKLLDEMKNSVQASPGQSAKYDSVVLQCESRT